MMENRSYDTYLGWLENGRGHLALGLDLEYTDPDNPAITAKPTHWALKYRRTEEHPDPGHGGSAGRARTARTDSSQGTTTSTCCVLPR